MSKTNSNNDSQTNGMICTIVFDDDKIFKNQMPSAVHTPPPPKPQK